MIKTYATVEQTVQLRKFQPFDGRPALQMQRLLTGKNQETGIPVDVPRELISPAQFFEQRLRGEDGDRKALDIYGGFQMGDSISTRLCVLDNSNLAEIKLVHGHPLIYTLNSKTELIGGGSMLVSEEQYHTATGLVLTSSEILKFRNNCYALPKKREEIFEFAAEGNIKLATEYKDYVCRSLGSNFNKVMGISLYDVLEFSLSNRIGLRLFGVNNLRKYRSCASQSLLYCIYERLVGVAPESLATLISEAPQKESTTLPALDDLVQSLE